MSTCRLRASVTTVVRTSPLPLLQEGKRGRGTVLFAKFAEIIRCVRTRWRLCFTRRERSYCDIVIALDIDWTTAFVRFR
jgi:hypothetical protein